MIQAKQGSGGEVTISASKREAAMIRVLQRLAELCGDKRNVDFDEDDVAEARPLRTTLAELKDAVLIERVVSGGRRPYSLTIAGWFEAQQVSGRFASAEFNERRARVLKVLKTAVDGRRAPALLDWKVVAQVADVPSGWLLNVLDAQVFHQLDSQGRYWLRFDKGSIWVEPTFGLEPPSNKLVM